MMSYEINTIEEFCHRINAQGDQCNFKELPGLPNNVALKPSDLHLFLEFLQKFVAFSSVFIYH